jgi:hypothetical protein
MDMGITPGEFQKYSREAMLDAICLDEEAFRKGLEQGARQERQRLASLVNLDGIRNAVEKGLIHDENSAMIAEILVKELSK